MHRPTLTILKIGGKVLEVDDQLKAALSYFAGIAGAKILVHGGGKQADVLIRALDIEPQMLNGRRITDAATLEVVTMVYAGLVNKKVVSLLQAMGCNALGLTGADGNLIKAHKRVVTTHDYGFAGDIDTINGAAIQQLLDLGYCPAFCAITHDAMGQLLNTNADTIASRLATAMAKGYDVQLQFCFEKAGVMTDPDRDDTVISLLTPALYDHYKTSGAISGGMLPKLDNAFDALQKGVSAVWIGHLQALKARTATKIEWS
ncbi:MAG: acetylglutamate kinase [Saprospiraceae bacterium]